MRRSLAIALIVTLAVAPIIAFFPPPQSADPAIQIAQHAATVKWRLNEDWFGGFSGLEVTPDGKDFFVVTDRGHTVRGRLQRNGDTLTGVTLVDARELADHASKLPKLLRTDAEGLALDDAGRLNVSFEHAHRIQRYDAWGEPPVSASATDAWGALSGNGSLEMVAVDRDGTVFTIPEAAAPGAYAALVYRQRVGQNWEQPFTLPLSEGFSVVGGDFGPDGRLYLLERSFTLYGFRSQVRRMRVTPGGFETIETILQTPLRRHGNLEGLAVWSDSAGATRLIMINDNNFLPLLRTYFTEYVVND